MTTLTIELDEAQVARLNALAAAWQADISDVIDAALHALEDQHALPAFTPEHEAAIRAGLADIEAGRTVDHGALFARLDQRHGV
jgi:predicted transcriptional regulator